ncbi:hypothetical protein EVAR_88029_1 [Eumeta japonica]|uniref:Uncharacterized protein n=1 Tax=Eumeta variegata TaxID=151549 RepID=A0A4C1VCV5_EUMVA|nr:hypothetical protein EVAR_88029_1 [Eumeta japonica]
MDTALSLNQERSKLLRKIVQLGCSTLTAHAQYTYTVGTQTLTHSRVCFGLIVPPRFLYSPVLSSLSRSPYLQR